MRFIEGGERAVTRFEEGAAGYEARAYRGLGVFSSMPVRAPPPCAVSRACSPPPPPPSPFLGAQYEVSDDQDSVQMLQRSTQVGEFYRMHPPPVWNKIKKLPGTYADLLIYDEEADKHQHIRFETALHAALPIQDANENSDLQELVKLLGGSEDYNLARQKFFNELYQAYLGRPADINPDTGDQGTDLVIPGEANAEAQTALQRIGNVRVPNINKAKIIDAVKKGVWIPFCIVIARPFIEHLMMSAIMTVSGRDTGATLFGPADMQISANTSVKTIEGHYTCHTKSVITKPQNVYVMRDIMCTGYVAGGNCQFFGMGKDNTFNDTPVDQRAAKVREMINQRLSFHDDAAGEYASMLAFVAPYSDVTGGYRDQVISLSERLLPWEVTRHTINTTKDYFPGGHANFTYYKSLFGLNQLHFGEDVRAVENMEFISQGSVNNALCFIGPHRRYNPFSSNFFELVPGQGHFGPDAIPGDARWRRGESVSLRAARNSMVGLEVAAQSQLALRAVDGIGDLV